jgi:uncharacterized protein YbjT (DUF2867 family)
MKSKVLLFGATGSLGQFVFWELIQKGFSVTVVVRDKVKAVNQYSYWANIIELESQDISSLDGDVFASHDVVVSLLGNRISHAFNMDQTGGMDFFEANEFILRQSVKFNIKKFGAVSPFHEKGLIKQAYFKRHDEFQIQVTESGIDFTLVNSTLLFSSLTRQLKQAGKGKNIVIGEGLAKVNPIFDGDVASLFVESLSHKNKLIHCGGPEVFTRMELAQRLQLFYSGDFKVRSMNPLAIPTILPYLKLKNQVMHDRMAYFYYVNRRDFITTSMGSVTLSVYLSKRIDEKLKSRDRMRLLQKQLLV